MYGEETSGRVPEWSGKEEECSEAAESVHEGWCGKSMELNPPWMDWVASGIDFFGCEGEGVDGKSVLGRALMLQHTSERLEKEDRDYARLHEQFFEALLQEQVQTVNVTEAAPALASCPSVDESINSGVSSASSLTYDSTSVSSTRTQTSTKTQKRRRPFKLGRLSPHHKHHTRVAPIEAYNRKYNPALNGDQVSLETIAGKELPSPESFLRSDCVMQKDKGKGEPLGHSISAEGKEACLTKLREKMAIVIQVSGEATGIRRRMAKVSANAAGYIETRSMLEVRLGFLSMQYGLLLRWDYHRTGKIAFVLLRKMCQDGFYTKIPAVIEQEPQTTTTTITKRQLEAPPLVVRSTTGSNAIYQRIMGTEVVLVDPPYRVPQPEVFAPSVLSVEINHIEGLSKKSRWTISITFAGHTEMTLLHYNNDKRLFESKRTAMEWEMLPVSSFDLTSLEIRLFEQRKRKNSHSRLSSTTTVPIGGLVAQPSTAPATSWQITMPFTHNEKASLTLSMVHQSDYSHWLFKELNARKTEEVAGFHWKTFSRKRKSGSSSEASSSQGDRSYVWDWLCGFCFKEYYLPADSPCW